MGLKSTSRQTQIEEPGDRHAKLRADLRDSLRAYRHAMMTTDNFVDMALVIALAVAERERRASLMLAAATFVLGAVVVAALLL